MKAKAACIGATPAIVAALSGTPFAARVLTEVVGKALGVEGAMQRPAEYYVQHADTGAAPAEGVMGVEVRLSGVSRDGRSPKMFHEALKSLDAIVQTTVMEALLPGERCQVFVVIMLDEQIETSPGSRTYSNNLESTAAWVEKPGSND